MTDRESAPPRIYGEHEQELRVLRLRMVRQQIEGRGIRDARVLEAMRSIPRHLFVPPESVWEAYDDNPLPIGEGQTISQPYMVAWMTELLGLQGGEKVLEVGTGSGYQAAILGWLAREVWSVERQESLASQARERLALLGLDNVKVVVGDGSRGLPEHAPYDAVVVTAGSPSIPQPLTEQLAEGGRLVIPVGPPSMQTLTLVVREGDGFRREEKGGCVFVPLVGKYGWKWGRRFA
jgi:protein-L-isoaspartate(D-aspartate) O-methyltransferase